MIANHNERSYWCPKREYAYEQANRVQKWNAPSNTIPAHHNSGQPIHPQYTQGYLNEEETISIRNYNVTPQLPANGLSVAELFCGGGLMAVGLQAAGYDITFANDFDKRASEAYAYNIGDHVVCGDITSDLIQARIPDADIIAGGPPCQDYSVAGAGAGVEGDRGKLVWTYLRIIADKQPKAFVFENVKGLLTKKHRPTFDALIAEFDRIGYAVTWRLINAWDYGVAQKRERVFIVGVRKDLGFSFAFPEPNVEDYRTQVLRDVIGDLPEPNGASNHVYKPLTDGVYRHAKEHRIGYHPTYAEPAFTIRTIGQDVTETPQPRRFTVRECLRIQSVPDTYVLPDTISLSAQYRIVGNGVASRVSYVLGVASRVSYVLGVALAAQLNAALTQEVAYDDAA